jgi:hypothetical protein
MGKLLAIALVSISVGLFLGLHIRSESPIALAGGAECAAQNGDVNADGKVDVSDAITILGYLYLGNPGDLMPLCESKRPSAGLPDTGQTGCYDGIGANVPCDSVPCQGQDGTYPTGCPPADRFVDNEDGTVTDACTGLMWQRQTADVNEDGHSTDEDFLPWCNALAYCEDLGLAGHDDWRLPSVRELQSIADYGRSNPSINSVFDALWSGYWSSTSFPNPANAWIVGFDVGFVGYDDKVVGSYYIRAVRNAP